MQDGGVNLLGNFRDISAQAYQSISGLQLKVSILPTRSSQSINNSKYPSTLDSIKTHIIMAAAPVTSAPAAASPAVAAPAVATDRTKPYFPLAGQASDGWSKEGEATATCFCGAVQLAFVSLASESPPHLCT